MSADDLSRQALMAQAEDLAVEDCLLVLEKALLQSKLTPEAYMKQVSTSRLHLVRTSRCFAASHSATVLTHGSHATWVTEKLPSNVCVAASVSGS